MDHENDKTIMSMTSSSAQTEPGVTVGRSVLRRALHQAERSVDEIMAQIRDMEIQRDEHARMAGASQGSLDSLAMERDRRTAHLRALTVAVAP